MPDRAPSARAEALIAACRALYSAIDRLDQEAAVRAGVSRNDLRALNVLESGPVRAGELAEALGVTTGSVSGLVDRLERQGLARRERDTGDRRVVLVAPTDRMYETLGPLYGSVAQHLGRAAAGYTAHELEAALKHIRDVVHAYDRAASPP